MSSRTPPNKGIVLFPAVFHVRCTAAMRDEVKARGGGNWLRSLVAANTRLPDDTVTTADAGAFAADVSPAIASDTSSKLGLKRRRVSRVKHSPGKKVTRVSLDKRKRRTV